MQGDVPQSGLFSVRERNTFELHVPKDRLGESPARLGMRFVLRVENFEDPVGSSAGREGHLVQLVQFTYRLVEEGKQKKEEDELTQLHSTAHHGLRSESEYEGVAYHPYKRHARRVKSPPAHDAKARLSQLV